MNTVKIVAITLVAGLCLALIYEVTAEPRAEQEAKARQEALEAVFEDAASFEEVEYGEDLQAEVTEYVESMGVSSSIAEVTEITYALDDAGEFLGYVFTVDAYKGYGGTIEFVVGIREDGTVNGYSITDISETVGLGMNAQEEEFSSQFENKNVEYFTFTKTGSTAENEVDAISGATITTTAMTNGMNAALYTFDYLEGEGE